MNVPRLTRRNRESRLLEAGAARLLRLEQLEDRRMLAARAAEAVNLFATDVYEHLQREEGNLFFSPLSIATSLAMAYAGASGQTAAEMEQVLHLGSEPGIHGAFGDLMDSIRSHAEYPSGTLLTVANAIWPDDSFPVRQSFLELISGEYAGHVQNVDYANPEQAESIINQWVSQRTLGEISDLVSDLDSTIRMVLTNAVFFNGNWEFPFDPRHTALSSFELNSGEVINAQTMYTELNAPYARFNGYAVLELPFDGGARNSDYSMVFVLPPENEADDLTPELFTQIDAWLDGAPQEQYVLVRLPKIDTGVSTSLNQLLIGLGMPTAFSLGAADFSAMTPEEVFISKVFHKATLTMNEQGTRAAAATEIEFGICFAAGTPVLTPQGAKPIEELEEGDLVLARDETNVEGELEPKRIERVHHRNAAILELRLRGQVIRTTETHPFFVKGKGWTPANELRPRNFLSTSGGDWVEVDAVRITRASEPVYNLRVADHHTYFVGRKEWGFSVWVHNACGGEPEFFADRPFHLMIRDNITSTIAFMGRIDDPRQLQNDVTPGVIEANADFDGNQMVDGADFLAWQRGYGMTTNASRSHGDSNADGDVDARDFSEWMEAHGQPTALLVSAAASGLTPPAATYQLSQAPSLVALADAAMAMGRLTGDGNELEPQLVDDQELVPQQALPRVVDHGPLPATATDLAIELLTLRSVLEQATVDAELEDELLDLEIG
jgi:serpin B